MIFSSLNNFCLKLIIILKNPIPCLFGNALWEDLLFDFTEVLEAKHLKYKAITGVIHLMPSPDYTLPRWPRLFQADFAGKTDYSKFAAPSPILPA